MNNTVEKLININEKLGNYAFKPLPAGIEHFIITYKKLIRGGLYNYNTLRYANFFINKI